MALAGCGDGTETKSASQAAGATNGIVLNRGNGVEPKSLDPAVIDGIWEAQISGDMILGLTTEDAESKPIVRTIISLTHALGRKVVAEGVETEGQARLLRQLRCDQYQGYLFSKPLPAEEIERLLLSHASKEK